MSVKAMKSGAVGFLTKPFRQQDLLNAVQRSLTRDRIVPKNSETLLNCGSRNNKLSIREREVMNLVVRGMLNKQIAAEVGASEATVKIAPQPGDEKMQAESLPDLVRIADRLKSKM
jgi:FixJ family two-component response regulator